MFFEFIKYISPNWYFNLNDFKNTIPYEIDYNKLSEQEQKFLSFDCNYSSEFISKIDIAFQAWQKGIIKLDSNIKLSQNGIRPLLKDEYYFVRKNYKFFWSIYILIIRILSLNNPFNEIVAFYSAKRAKKSKPNILRYQNDDYSYYHSRLLKSNPFISIIIPTLNRYKYLDDVIKDLEIQDYTNFEVIIIDQSENFDSEFYKNRNVVLTVIQQKEKALWQARNTGVKLSKGDYLLFYDDDSRVEADWITQHLKTLDFFNADISSGVSLSVVGAEVPFHYSYLRWGDQIDTGNFLIKKEIFKTTGLFDRQFERQRMGDGEFGLRCYLNGFKNISNPYAKRIHLKVSEGGLRQMGSWDAFRPKNIFSPRPIPSVNYLTRKYFGNANAIFNILLNVPASIVPYKFKSSKKHKFLGVLLFIIGLPIFLIPIIRSWNISTRMLKEGSKIDQLD